jgi:3-phosphoshikimate 1-carboxyvinyltransferase
MIKTIHQSAVTGTVSAPPSKSLTQRAIAAALLAHGKTVIKNPSFCNDSLAALKMAESLGATVSAGDDYMEVTGTAESLSEVFLNCGESGLALRMFSPVAALLSRRCTLTGEGSLLKRPVSMITDALSQLGTTAESDEGFLPLTVKGNLKGGKIEIDGSSGSQILTGLLLALPCAETGSEINVFNLKSKPYIGLTLKLLADFGIYVENQGYSRFIIPGNQVYNARNYCVEGDWSGSAFLLVAGALAGEVRVRNLQWGSLQADIAVIEALKIAGAEVIIGSDSVKVINRELRSFEFDATDSPDLFPPLAVLASGCHGTTRIKGVSRLEHKESNRSVTIAGVLNGLGIDVRVSGDEMLIEGGAVSGATVSSYDDHRIAMMASVAALRGHGSVTVTGAEAVSKSYPGFFDDLSKLGVLIS